MPDRKGNLARPSLTACPPSGDTQSHVRALQHCPCQLVVVPPHGVGARRRVTH